MDRASGKGMVLTGRDRRLVTDVADFQVLTREHLTALGHFTSKTRANAVLLRLVQFGYLSRRYQPSVAGTYRALYYVGPQAFALLGQPQAVLSGVRRQVTLLSDLFLAHQLLVTDVRLAFARSSSGVEVVRWLGESALRTLDFGFVPDGHVEYCHEGKQFGAFVEIDRGTESLTRWSTKVQQYVLLAKSDRYRQAFGRPYFRVLVLGESADRVVHLRRATARLTDRIFWFTTAGRLVSEGPLVPIWWRPLDATVHSLTEP